MFERFLPSVVGRPRRLCREGCRPLHQLLGRVHEGAAEDDRVEEDEDAGGSVQGREDDGDDEQNVFVVRHVSWKAENPGTKLRISLGVLFLKSMNESNIEIGFQLIKSSFWKQTIFHRRNSSKLSNIFWSDLF